MARNIEIKARLSAPERQLQLAEAIADQPSRVIVQEDTFFNCTTGRLKLRVFEDGTGELIQYQRDDQAGPKTSSYVLSPTSDPNSLKTALDRAYGVRAVVRKTRKLLMVGRTRIHLDSVEGLGDFLELEVVLEHGENEAEGRREADQLMERLEVTSSMLIESAYVDLLVSRTR